MRLPRKRVKTFLVRVVNVLLHLRWQCFCLWSVPDGERLAAAESALPPQRGVNSRCTGPLAGESELDLFLRMRHRVLSLFCRENLVSAHAVLRLHETTPQQIFTKSMSLLVG